MLELPPDEDESPDDDAPEADPDPAPPRQADVSIHEADIVENGFDLTTDAEGDE